jgi:hypothetical protein
MSLENKLRKPTQGQMRKIQMYIKFQSYAVFSGFTNSIIISLCLIKSSNQMCDGRLDGLN